MRLKRKHACTAVLRDTFGVSSFRPGQEQAADVLLDHQDLLCILPTGAGKSLCWQLPAVMLGGLTVVISPLIVLMHDQARHLERKGIPCVQLDSLMTPEERAAGIQRLSSGKAGILFIAPERLDNAAFLRLCEKRQPSLVVVDEAHCVIQWGDSFRPAYQKIGTFIEQLPKRPAVCAMTATADRSLQKKIISSLGLRRPKHVIMPVERKNLHYHVIPTIQTNDAIQSSLRSMQGKAVIFCRRRVRTEELSTLLNDSGISAAPYHAGLERTVRSQVLNDFLSGKIRVVTATSAFGMGVDVPDIRLIIHDHLPDNMIDYVQQSGRAGRDGQDADCILLFPAMDLLRFNTRCRRIHTQNKGNRFRAYWMIRQEWLPFRRVLQWCLTEKCLSQGISSFFAQRSAPCGHCSACLKKHVWREVPNIPRMTSEALYMWILQLHRDELTLSFPQAAQATDAQLFKIANTEKLLDDLPFRNTYLPYLRLFRYHVK